MCRLLCDDNFVADVSGFLNSLLEFIHISLQSCLDCLKLCAFKNRKSDVNTFFFLFASNGTPLQQVQNDFLFETAALMVRDVQKSLFDQLKHFVQMRRALAGVSGRG